MRLPEKVIRAASIRQGFAEGVALLLLLASGAPAGADELVQIAPHRAAGQSEATGQTPPLFGYLARPEQPGRRPAVVVLHWCVGFGPHVIAAAARLKSWGYVALAPDSLGGANMCNGGAGLGAEVADSYASLRWLAAQDFVDGGRVAAIGYSMGATAALNAVEQGRLHDAQPERFAAAVAYYPACEASSGNMTVPALILIGERDDWTLAEPCRRLAAHESDVGVTRSAGGVPVRLVVYPGATHGFDLPGQPQSYLGHQLAYDAEVASDAAARVRAFLDEVLR
jgi:dienelactone hydrolase